MGVLAAIALLAAPAAFATLERSDAGRFVGRLFAIEAYSSLAAAALLYLFERRFAREAAARGEGSILSAEMLLVAGALFCTIAGYFGIQPMLDAARAGQAAHSFASLHAASSALFGLKTLLVVVLAWRLGAR